MKESGILLHISSLPNNEGIGTMGKCAYDFVDFLSATHQQYWQVLPINPTSYGDSPYQSPSMNAGNPYLIDLDMLCDMGLLETDDYINIEWSHSKERVDYSTLFVEKHALLKKAYSKFDNTDSRYVEFCQHNAHWLDDYCLFMSLKEDNNQQQWTEWSAEQKYRKNLPLLFQKFASQVNYHRFVQYVFFQQWFALKQYANDKGIKLIGDLPIYVALDSVDVWCDVKQFQLDKQLNPKCVAGCPPDGFSADGQLWGNPLYNWNYMKKTNYSWWIERIRHATKLFDKIRIDHFLGFARYYTIPYGRTDAKIGCYKKGPGLKMFDIINNQLNYPDVIAEDLGVFNKEVVRILDYTGYPGMKVILFAYYGEDSNNLNKYHKANSVVYTGTHDNETAMGWYYGLDDYTKSIFHRCANVKEGDSIHEKILQQALCSRSKLVIIPMQDYLGLDNNARMNRPNTLGNWSWRLTADYNNHNLVDFINRMIDTHRLSGVK